MKLGSIKNYKNSNPGAYSSKNMLDKNLFFQKIYPKKDLTDLHEEISVRQKIISNINRTIRSQFLLNDFQDGTLVLQQQKQSNIPLLKKKLNKKRNINHNKLNTKINMGPMVLYALRKRKKTIYIDQAKEKCLSFSKNFILSPFKYEFNSDYYKKIKNEVIKKRRNKKFLTQRINSFSPNNTHYTYKNNIYNNLGLDYRTKKENNSDKNKIFKRKMSCFPICTSNNQSNNNIIYDYKNKRHSMINPLINKYNNDSDFSNNTTRNKNNIIPSDSRNYTNNYFISNYSEKKNNNFINSLSTPRTNSLYYYSSSDTSNDNINFTTSKNKFTNSSSQNENKYIFNSAKNFLRKKNIIQNLDKLNNINYKKIKPKLIKDIRAKSQKTIKKLSNKFKTFFDEKVKSLNNITKACNTELVRLIYMNNKENKKNIKDNNKNNNEKIKNELDIRKDIFDKNTNEKSNKRKIKKFKILMNNAKVELNLSDADEKKTMNILKKKINIISDSIALNMIEKCLGIKKNVGFDVDELFNENIKKKKDIQKSKIEQIRKKAENNYKKMIKLRYIISESKKNHSDLDNNCEK